ncbi:ABC transporter ATP-binding protein [Thiotrichales bacterium 19S3-7]|nr:ABC transporter ATP-binding protein [Thiotrichales bacterium 19S3-7]MCF6801254.1 ABC transporter ATP-binding protein [Thiotrichales bacterium 19S3-11]
MDTVIDVQALTKSFNHKCVVDRVNLKIDRGEVYGFLGPNGSGKTTTIRMLCGLLIPDSGTGHCLGYDIIKDTEAIKTKVGYMTQHFSLHKDLTVFENLHFMARLYGVKQPKMAALEAIERLHFTAMRKNQLAGTLSGGWKQRLALAAATIHNPELLLLDEPTAGVDPQARREFWDHIHLLAQSGVTTLVSTHYMDEAERCTKLAYIVYGKLLTYGTAESIINESAIVTWLIEGDQLTPIVNALSSYKEIQCVRFGRSLHISYQTHHNYEAIIKKTIQPQLKLTKIMPSLEDVFIFLMKDHAGKSQ